MACPECGLESQPDQKFCRSCGARLQMTTQQMVEPPTVINQKSSSAIISRAQPQQASTIVFWGFVVMLVGTALGVLGKMLLHENLITVVGVLAALVGMFLVVYPYLAPPRRKEGDLNHLNQPEVITPPDRTRDLPPGNINEFIPSVTERTTDLLKTSTRKRAEHSENEHLDD